MSQDMENLKRLIKRFISRWARDDSINVSSFMVSLPSLLKDEAGNDVIEEIFKYMTYHDKADEFRSYLKRMFIDMFMNRSSMWVKPIDLYNISSSLLGNWKIYDIEIESLEKVTVHSGWGVFNVVFEIGLAFDTIRNLPYMPSSTIKGAIRSAYRRLKGKDEFRDLPDENIMFGSTGRIGSLAFTDAYPIDGKQILYPDIITPHYRPETESELDVSPSPLPHLVIGKGVRFKFLLFIKPEYEKYLDEIDDIENVDIESLKPLTKVLLYGFARGVGGRTSYGYSRFIIKSIKALRGGGDGGSG